MSAKPAIALARWADLITSNVVDAPSGLRDTGYLDNTPIEADLVNGLLKQFYLWALYLNDGALSGNHTVTGTLGVTAGLTVSAGGAAVTGNSSVTGTLGVSGTLNANGGITVPTGQAVLLSGTTTLAVAAATSLGNVTASGLITANGGISAFTATGLITANAGVTAAANQHVTVSGTGKYKHPTRTLLINGLKFVADVAANAPSTSTAGATFTNTPSMLAAIELPAGKRIIALRVTVFDSSGTVYQAKFADGIGALTNGDSCAGNGTLQTLTVSAINYTVTSSAGPVVFLQRTSGTGTLNIRRVEVDYDELT